MSKPSGKFLTLFTPDNKVSVHGIDQPTADLVSYSDGLMVIKVPGFSYSATNHPSLYGYSYAPAEYQVWEVHEFTVESNKAQITATGRLSFPVRGAKGTFPIPSSQSVAKATSPQAQ